MREKPPYLQNPDQSQIAFNAIDFGIIDSRFASACATHGSGDWFSWIAGGQEYTYTIKRIGRGFAKDDGTAVSAWEFTQTDQLNNTAVAYINAPEHELVDIFGEPLAPKLINDISSAAIDIAWETMELDEGVIYLIAENRNGEEIIIPNIISASVITDNEDSIENYSSESDEIKHKRITGNDAIRKALADNALLEKTDQSPEDNWDNPNNSPS